MACLMVILMHTPRPYSADGNVLSAISLLTAPCIGLFFMVSGALLLPVTKPAMPFLSHRLTKIAIPVLLWSLFYIAVDFAKTHDAAALSRAIVSIPFSVQGNGTFWFIYVLTGLYFLAPVVSPWLQRAGRKEILFFLLLWAVSLCYPFIRLFADVNQSNTGVLYYFAGYGGYFVLGYCLHYYDIRLGKWLLTVMFAFPPACALLCKLTHTPVDFYDMFWYLSIMTAMMGVALFVAVKGFAGGERRRNGRFVRLLTDFSNCSFGIYLIHYFIVREVLWRFDISLIPGAGGILETFLLATLLSYGIVHLISRLPKSEYLTGYKRK